MAFGLGEFDVPNLEDQAQHAQHRRTLLGCEVQRHHRGLHLVVFGLIIHPRDVERPVLAEVLVLGSVPNLQRSPLRARTSFREVVEDVEVPLVVVRLCDAGCFQAVGRNPSADDFLLLVELELKHHAASAGVVTIGC